MVKASESDSSDQAIRKQQHFVGFLRLTSRLWTAFFLSARWTLTLGVTPVFLDAAAVVSFDVAAVCFDVAAAEDSVCFDVAVVCFEFAVVCFEAAVVGFEVAAVCFEVASDNFVVVLVRTLFSSNDFVSFTSGFWASDNSS